MKLIIDILNVNKRHKLPNGQLKSHGKKGFTLLELMIGVALISIIMAVIVPVAMNMMPGLRLKKAARNLVSDMQRARINAIKEGLTWQITFNNGADSYQITSPGALPPTSLADYGSGVHFPPDGACGNATATWNPPPAGGPINQRATVNFTNRGTCAAGSTYLTNVDNTICYAITTTAACSVKLRKYNGLTPFSINHWIE